VVEGGYAEDIGRHVTLDSKIRNVAVDPPRGKAGVSDR
jgi:hypothetical protein